jgi:hypothetical protein
MRALRLLARRTQLDSRDGDPMLSTTLVTPGPRGFPLRDGHERLRSIQAAGRPKTLVKARLARRKP